MKKELLRHFAVYLALTTVAIGQPLLQLYGDNLTVFAAAKYEGFIVAWFGIVVLLAPALLLSLIELAGISILPRFKVLIHNGLVFAATWMVVLVVLRSISFGHWITDGAFTAAIAALLMFAYHSLNTIKSWITLLSPLALVVAVVFGVAASDVIMPPDVEVFALEEEPSAPRRDDVSVLWIHLDEAPISPLMNTAGEINAKRFPGFAALAKESTWYRNVTGTSQMTVVAVPSALTGKWPTDPKKPPILASYPQNLFTLMNGHMAMDAHEIATALCPKSVCSKISLSGGDEIANANATTTVAPEAESGPSRTSFSTFLKEALVVIGHKMLPERLRDNLPPIDESWGGFLGDLEPEAISPTTTAAPTLVDNTTLPKESIVPAKPNTVEEWKGNGAFTQVPVLQDVVARAARAAIPTLHFAHVLIPHRPWILAPDVRASRRLPNDPRKSENLARKIDNYQSLLRQYAATDVLIGDMVKALKLSGNWDRTMIVVTADHGITFIPGESYRDTVNPNNPAMLEDLYRIPLFIKYPDQKTGKIDDCAAASVDILPTVIAATGIDAGWKLDGADLRSACPVRATRPIMWNDGSAQLATGVPALMERVMYYNNWVSADTDVDGIYKVGLSGDLIGTRVPTTVVLETGVKWDLYDRENYQEIGTGLLALTVTRSRGTLTASRDFSSKEDGLLVVDGVIVGVIDELTGMKAGETLNWQSAPNSRLLQPGQHTVELWTADWSTGTPVLKKVG